MEWLSWILKYWLEVLFGLITGGFTLLSKHLYNKVKAEKEAERQELKEMVQTITAVNSGMVCILHNELRRANREYTTRGYCTYDEKEELTEMYETYAALGGNGTGAAAYKHCMELPEVPPSQNETIMKQEKDFIKIYN